MKLDKMAMALREARMSFGLDMTDLLILDEVVQTRKRMGEVTIMEIVESSTAASRATVHERIKRLCNDGYLRKDPLEGNLRVRVLSTSATYDKLVKRLGVL